MQEREEEITICFMTQPRRGESLHMSVQTRREGSLGANLEAGFAEM